MIQSGIDWIKRLQFWLFFQYTQKNAEESFQVFTKIWKTPSELIKGKYLFEPDNQIKQHCLGFSGQIPHLRVLREIIQWEVSQFAAIYELIHIIRVIWLNIHQVQIITFGIWSRQPAHNIASVQYQQCILSGVSHCATSVISSKQGWTWINPNMDLNLQSF